MADATSLDGLKTRGMPVKSQSTVISKISNNGSIFTDETSRRIYQWLALMEAGHQFLMAGIRMRLKPGEDEREVYRRWYQQQLQDHDRTLERMAARFKECSSHHGPASSTSNP